MGTEDGIIEFSLENFLGVCLSFEQLEHTYTETAFPCCFLFVFLWLSLRTDCALVNSIV